MCSSDLSLSEQLGKKKSGEPNTDLKKSTAEQQDKAFKKVADNLVEEGYVPKPGMSYDDVRNQQLKQQEAKSYERAQKEIEEERRAREEPKEEKTEETVTEEKPAKRKTEKPEAFIPDALEARIQAGDLGAVLNWLQTAAPQRIHRVIVSAIKGLKIKTGIRYVESLPNNDIAQYDPVNDMILVTTAGMKPSTLLHELVHAATVSVLDKFEIGRAHV